jgi:hypothetical protein
MIVAHPIFRFSVEHWVEGAIHRVVGSRPKASAYRVKVNNGSVQEEPLQTDYLPPNIGKQ